MIIKDVLETDPICADIKEKSYSIPDLKEVLETRTTALHVSPPSPPYPWVVVFRINLEFRILRLTFHRKSAK